MTLHPRILSRYVDSLGVERTSPDWAVRRVEEVLSGQSSAGRFADVIRCRAGDPVHPDLLGRRLILEHGGEVTLGDQFPPDLPYGYHHATGDPAPVLVLHAPSRCPQPLPWRSWFVAVQLYAARSRDSWGIGDLRDARRVGQWTSSEGSAGRIMLNPLHAPRPGPSPQPSPYFASSRIFRNPLYICVDEVPGADGVAEVSTQRQRALAANERRIVDHGLVWGAKGTALQAIWARQAADPATAEGVDAFLADQLNMRYVRDCAQLDPGTDPRFHAWLQLLIEDQLQDVGGGVIHDVAVGTDRAGIDARLWPDLFVLDGTKIGCPPDGFNTQGQDWGLPPLHPMALRAAGYEPFARAVRSAVSGAAGIRLDHVMGLERLFWIPPGGSPADGVYVRYDLQELLDVVAIESDRAGAFVIGEDLGTVPTTVRMASAERGLLGYRVMELDDAHPDTYPHNSAAAFTTHDLATVAGLFSGRDLAEQERLGLEPNASGTVDAVSRLLDWTRMDDPEDLPTLVLRIHEILARSPASLVAVTLDDLALVVERPNMPGTINQWPNWRIALPVPLEELLESNLAREVRRAVSSRAVGS